MSTQTSVHSAQKLAPRDWPFPVVYGVLAFIALAAFGLAAEGGRNATFQLGQQGDFFHIPNITVDAKTTGIVMGLLLAVLAGLSFWGQLKRIAIGNWLPVAVGVLFVIACLLYTSDAADDTASV